MAPRQATIRPVGVGIAYPAPSVGRRWTFVNPLAALWASRPDLVLIVAIAMAIADPLRVAPQFFSDLFGGTINSGHQLIVGAADVAALVVFALIRPELWSVVCMATGLVVGVGLKMVGAPALPGWFLMFAPWVIWNWRNVKLSASEKRKLVALPIVFAVWAALLLTGHIVDPTMQGQHSIGWVYTTSDGPIEVGKPVQVKARPGIYLTRRARSISGGMATLSADNPNFGEIEGEQLTVPLSSLRMISRSFSPRRLAMSLTPQGRFEAWASFSFPPRDLKYDPMFRFVAVFGENAVTVYGREGCQQFRGSYWASEVVGELGGEPRWEGAKLVYRADPEKPSFWRVWDASSSRGYGFDIFASLPDVVEVDGKVAKFVKSGGKAYVRPGAVLFEAAKDSPRGTKMDMLIGRERVHELSYQGSFSTRTEVINIGKWPIKVMPM